MWGCCTSLLAISTWRALSASHNWSPSRSQISWVYSSWGPLSRWGLAGERLGLHLPTLGRNLSTRGVTVPCSSVVPYLCTHLGQMWRLKGSPYQTVAASRWCIMAIMSESDRNARTISVSESCSTPSGCSWPNPTHSLSTSSSLKKMGHNGVPSPWVVTSMQIQFVISVSLPRVSSLSAKAVTVDVVDMLVRGNQMGWLMQGRGKAWDVRLRKILWLTTGTMQT